MNTPNPQPDLEEIRARADAATAGPWVSGEGHDWEAGDIVAPTITDHYTDPTVEPGHPDYEWDAVRRVLSTSWHANDRDADFEFIVHAREDIPALLDEIERLALFAYPAKED